MGRVNRCKMIDECDYCQTEIFDVDVIVLVGDETYHDLCYRRMTYQGEPVEDV